MSWLTVEIGAFKSCFIASLSFVGSSFIEFIWELLRPNILRRTISTLSAITRIFYKKPQDAKGAFISVFFSTDLINETLKRPLHRGAILCAIIETPQEWQIHKCIFNTCQIILESERDWTQENLNVEMISELKVSLRFSNCVVSTIIDIENGKFITTENIKCEFVRKSPISLSHYSPIPTEAFDKRSFTRFAHNEVSLIIEGWS